MHGGELFFQSGRKHRKTLLRSGTFEAREFPKARDIFAVVAGIVDRSFGDEGAAGETFRQGGAEARMAEDALEGSGADFAAADVRVTVDAPAEWNFRIVGVKNSDIVKTNRVINLRDSAVQAGFGRNVIA